MKRIICGAIHPFGDLPPVKLKPRNLWTLGLASVLLAFRLETLGQKLLEHLLER